MRYHKSPAGCLQMAIESDLDDQELLSLPLASAPVTAVWAACSAASFKCFSIYVEYMGDITWNLKKIINKKKGSEHNQMHVCVSKRTYANIYNGYKKDFLSTYLKKYSSCL